MKLLLCSTIFAALCSTLCAQAPESAPKPAAPTAPASKVPSSIFDWEQMKATPTANGTRRDLFEGPTDTLDKIHCHITTLNAGQNSGEPRRHLQEEVIIIKEGTVEATVDGRTQTIGSGSVIFFAANAVTRLRNVGEGTCTYVVLYYVTPLTPKK